MARYVNPIGGATPARAAPLTKRQENSRWMREANDTTLLGPAARQILQAPVTSKVPGIRIRSETIARAADIGGSPRATRVRPLTIREELGGRGQSGEAK
jgi:hypothetical protein